MDAGFSRIERKLDRFIEVQLQSNEIVDRWVRVGSPLAQTKVSSVSRPRVTTAVASITLVR
jgi:predicted DNA-binding WGR domain protein